MTACNRAMDSKAGKWHMEANLPFNLLHTMPMSLKDVAIISLLVHPAALEAIL